MNTPLEQPQIPPSLNQHGERKFIYPAEVKGFFRKHRNWTQALLLAFFLLTPWLTINGKQALLLDVVHREFHIFGLSLYAHDAPLLFLIFAIAVFGLIFITTVWGRVFCGWACPQTVFIDGVFRRIEILVEGKYLERRKMAQSSMTSSILFKKLIKWSLYVIAASLIAHSFIAFFVGAKNLIAMMQLNPTDNWTYFVIITSITLIILFDFAWFREQFCLIVCPYGRFQSVLLGSRTLNIAYDIQRGEPRKGSAPSPVPQGDCVNCRRCVEVCPTGIDIRQGLQLECISCTACIDACDEIMEKVKKPKGLIRYMNTHGGNSWSIRSPRAWFSLFIVSVALFSLIGILSFRKDVDFSVLRAKDALFQKVLINNTEHYTNHFKVHVKNQTQQPMSLKMSCLAESTELEITTITNPIELAANENKEVHIFIKFLPEQLKNGQLSVDLKIENTTNKEVLGVRSIHLVGPGGL